MNHVYRIIWNDSTGAYQAVAETAGGRGKKSLGKKARAARLLGLAGLVAGSALAEPTGGQISAGQGSIQQAGPVTTIRQDSSKLAINWQSFSVGTQETVNFVQPGASAIALNRVVGTDGSSILGNINANGQVFLLNPNGVLFGRSAQVNVGGLLASTLSMSDADFLAGRYVLQGNGTGVVRNEGTLNAAPGGYIALVGAQVQNSGTITADKGTAALAAGNKVTLDFAGDGLLRLSVDEGTLNALAANGGVIRADGGTAVLTARAADTLAATVVNNTGLIQARTLENRNGTIRLLGGSNGGTVQVDGTLDASAPNGGNGGFIETSGATVKVSDSAHITTQAAQGQTGKWLIDPTDYTVAASGGDMTGAALSNALTTTDVEIQSTAGGSAGSGDVNINDTVSWSANTLTLNAQRNVNINAVMSGSGTAGLALWYGQGAVAANNTASYNVNAPVDLASSGSFQTKLGSDGTPINWTIITSLGAQGSTTGTDLQGINGNLAGYYVLGSDIDASATAGWNGGKGFEPLGNPSSNVLYATQFTGAFDGLNHSVKNLTINNTVDPGSYQGGFYVGLFSWIGYGSVVRNVGLAGGSIAGDYGVGALAGENDGTISNVYSTANVTGSSSAGIVNFFGANSDYVGGLVGFNYGSINQAYATGNVNIVDNIGYASASNVGGLVGVSSGSISNSYVTGSVSGAGVGWFCGLTCGGATSNSFYATTDAAGNAINTGSADYYYGTTSLGRTYADLQRLSTFSSWGSSIAAQGGSGAAWRIYDGNTTPLLRSFLRPYVVTVTPDYDGLTTSFGSIASFTYTGNISDPLILGTLTSGGTGGTLTLSGGAAGSYVATLATSLDGVYSTQQGYDLSFKGSRVISTADTAGGAAGDVVLPSGGLSWTSGTLNINTSGNVSASAALNGTSLNISAANVALAGGSLSNSLTVNTAGTLSNIAPLSTAAATITAPDITATFLDNLPVSGSLTLNTSGSLVLPSYNLASLTLNAGGTITEDHAVTVSGLFDLQNGDWVQNSATLPAFSAGDFRLTGGSFLRVQGGDGSSASPYRIADVYGLQSMAQSWLLGDSFVLTNEIDASGTANWNAGAGFVPIGNTTTAFTGSLDGQSHSISGLTIYRPGNEGTGLFGVIQNATVENVGVAGGNITGGGKTGALAGAAYGSSSLANVYATANVGGTGDRVGGLVGYDEGSISNAYAGGNVNGASYVGGLVGQQVYGSISNTYASGSVGGSASLGGLVGSMGFIDASNTFRGMPTLANNFYATTDSNGNAINNGGGYSGAWGGNYPYYNKITGLTRAQLQSLGSYATWGSSIDAQGGTGSTWRIYDGLATPLLRSFLTPYTLSVVPDFDGSGTALGNVASYSGGTNDPLLVNTNRLTLTGLAGGNGYTASLALYSTQQGYDLSGAAVRTISTPGTAAGDVSLANGANWTSGTLVIATAGTATAAGSIQSSNGSFVMNGGNWVQNSSTLPSFSVKDFSIAGGSFLRVLGGDGSSSSPYEIADVYGLQGMASTSLLSRNFALANDIDASSTASWNAGAGFASIGTAYDPCNGGCLAYRPFTGTFDGQSHVISGLTIYRPSASYQGLFGITQNATVKNVGLAGGYLTGRSNIGPLVGYAMGGTVINNVFATTGVHSAGGGGSIGGLVGSNAGNISNAYATGTVNADDTYRVGALNVSYSYNSIGGLVGYNNGGISNSYAAGSVRVYAPSTSNPTWAYYIGGLVGRNDGGVANSFYATTNSGGGTVNNGGSAIQNGDYFWTGNTVSGATGLTYAQLENLGTYAAWGGSIDAQGGTGSVWRIYDGLTTPLLRSFLTPYNLQATFDGSGTAMTNIASYEPVATNPANRPDAIQGSLTDGTSLTLTGLAGGGGYTATVGGATAALYSGQRGYDIVNAGRVISTPGTAAGEVSLANGATWTQGTLNISTTGSVSAGAALHGVTLTIGAHDVSLAGATTSGSLTINATGDVGSSAALSGTNLAIAGDDVSLAGVTASGNLTLNAGGTIGNSGATNVAGIFTLQNGDWMQDGSTLPSFSVNDFRLAGGSFVRALGGDGSNASPYRIADVYGLQGISSLLGASFALANDIDATSAGTWNAGAGFIPIGTAANPFTGSLDGQDHAVTHLVMNRPQDSEVGLFGHVGTTGSLSNIGVSGSSFVGGRAVGPLAAQNDGTITDAYADSSVSGAGVQFSYSFVTPTNNVSNVTYTPSASLDATRMLGGLVGVNTGTVSRSYASGSVSNSFQASFQVGDVFARLTTVNASFSVAGDQYLGGLVGQNLGRVSSAYATGSVTNDFRINYGTGIIDSSQLNFGSASFNISSNSFVGGLAGGGGTIDQSYATGTVSGTHSVVSTFQQPRPGYTFDRSFSVANQAGSIQSVGGLAGNGTASNSFYATTADAAGTTAINNGGTAGGDWSGNSVGEARTLAQLQSLSNYASWGSDIDNAGGTGSIWRIYDGNTTPLLRSFLKPYAVTGVGVAPVYDGWTTLAMGDIGAVTLTGLNFSSSDPLVFGTATGLGTGGGTLTLSGGAAGTYTATASVAMSGVYSTQQGYDLVLTGSRVISTPDTAGSAAGDIVLPSAGLSWTSGKLVVDTTGNVSAGAALSGLALDVQAHNIALAGASLSYGLSLTATGSLSSSGMLTSPVVSVTAPAITQALVSQLAVSDHLALDTSGSLALSTLNVNDATIAAAGDVTISGAVTGHNLDITASNVSLADAAVSDLLRVRATNDVTSSGLISGAHQDISGGTISLASVNAGSDLKLAATGSITASGTLSGDRLDIAGNSIAMAGVTATGTLTLNATGTITNSGATNVGGLFTLLGGNWVQNASTLPSFSTGDFRIAGGSFLRVVGGDGSTASPYLVADVYGLQGMASTPLLGQSFALANDIDASAAAAWDGGAGFTPIGNGTHYFTGSFDGQGHVIGNLAINRAGNNGTGLFGVIQDATVTNVGLAGGNIVGGDNTGALVGVALGTSSIDNVYATAGVQGGGHVGGLAGYSEGSISRSYATGGVNGDKWVGGLVGYMQGGALDNSHAAGMVGGNDFAGGLVGYLAGGSVSTVYATGNVAAPSDAGGLIGAMMGGGVSTAFATGDVVGDAHGGSNTGGLVGYMNSASILDAYATGNVSGFVGVGGLLGQAVYGNITNTYATGGVTGRIAAGALTGATAGTNLAANFSDGSLTTQSSTYAGAGWSIDAEGGTGSTWRIYEGSTLPLLRAFLTPLTATLQSGLGKTYDGSAASGSAGYTLSDGTASVSVSGSASINYATGSRNAGAYSVAGGNLAVSGDLYSGQLGYDISYAGSYAIAQKQVTGTVTTSDKVYDGTTAASVSGTLNTAGIVSGDVVSLKTDGGSFADKNVGTAKVVDVSSALQGADAGNYVLVNTGGALTANITPAALTVSGVTAQDKVYDASTVATLNTGAAVLGGLIAGDVVTVSGLTGGFADKNAGTDKAVAVSGATLGGADAGNYTVSNPTGLTASITPATLTVTGVTAQDKVYDTTTAASLAGTASLLGVLGTDSVSVGGLSGSFADKNAGTNKDVTVAGATLAGIDAGNYTVSNPTGLTASITPAALTVSGVTAQDKVYDRSTAASLDTSGVTLNGVLGSDSVSVSGLAGSFADKNAGTNKAVAVSGATLGGADGGNYVVSNPTGLTASITPASLAVSGVTAQDKVYDTTTAAALNTSAASLSGVISGDAVSVSGMTGSFADKNAGTNKSVTVAGATLGGADAGNYTVTNPTGVTASITPASLTVGGVVAQDKVYDRTTAASLDTSAATLSGVLAGDTVSVSGLSGSFADRNVGTSKAVTVNGATLSGADGGNYVVSAPAGLTASIAPASLTVSGVTAQDKVYDTTTTASLLGAASLVGVIAGDTVTVSGLSGSFADKNAGTNKSVTVSGATLGGADGGNYVVSNPTGLTASITPASLTVSGVTAQDKVYDRTATASLDTTAATLNGVLGSDSVSVSGLGGNFADKNAGTNKSVTVGGATLAGADAANYTVANPTGLAATITPASLTVSGVIAQDKVYDRTTTASLDTTAATLNGVLAGDAVSVSNLSGSFADKNAGANKSVTVAGATLGGADGGNYIVSNPTGLAASITPAALTVSGVIAQDKVYDRSTTASLDMAAATLSGVLAGDAVSVSGLAGSFADKNAGTNKTVTVGGATLGGADAGNYTVTNPTGLTASITPAALTVSGVTAQDKVYDTTTTASLGTGAASLVGVLAGDAVNVAGLSGSFADKNAGTNKAVTVAGATLGGADASNYTVTNPAGLTASITPASLTVSGVTAQDKVYDATSIASLNTGAATLVGVLAGDAVNVSGLSGSFADKNAGANKAVTVNGATLGGADGANYIVSNPAGLTASITPAQLTMSGVTAQDKIYDATTSAALNTGAVNLVGVIAGDTVSVSGLSGSFADKNAGTNKAVAVSGATLGGTDGGNYTVSNPSGLTASITPAQLTVGGVTAQDKVYDTTTAASLNTGFASLVGVLGSDTVSVSGLSGSFADKNAGTNKSVTVAGATLAGADAANYTVANPTGLAASITPASLTVSGVTALDKVYDRTTAASLDTSAAALAGVLAGDTVSVSGLSGSFGDRNVGTNKAVTVNGATLGGVDAGNYTVANPAGLTASITPAQLTVSGVTAQDKVYDATTTAALNTGAATLAGVLAGDTVSVSGLSGSFADKNAGTNKSVTVSGATLGGADGGNYVVSNPTGLVASITPAALTVSGVTAQDKAYDRGTTATLATAAANLVGVIAGDTVSVSGLSGSFADKNAGTNKAVTVAGATLGGADAGNYTVTNPTGLAASITPASLTVSGVTAQDKVYDATTAASLNTGAASLVGVLAGDSVSVSGLSGSFADKNAGTNKAVTVAGATLSGADGSNYVVSNPSGLTASITPAALTVSGVSAQDKVYDATTTASLNTGAAILVGVIAGDTVSVSGLSGSFADKNAGTSKAVAVSGATLGGADGGNYTVSNPTGITASITPASLTVSGVTALDKVYDTTTIATLNTGSASLGGVVAGDAVSVSGMTGSFADKNVGTSKAVTVAGATLGGADAGNYTVNNPAGVTAGITPATLTVVGVGAQDKVYDRTTTASLDTSAATLSGVLAGDTVSLSGLSGSFADRNAGTSKAVTVSGATLGGADGGNYTVGSPTGLTASITPAQLSVSGVTAQDKVYDRTITASLDTSAATLSGVLAGDSVSVSGLSGSFADKNAGTNKAVTVAGAALGGADAGNYTVSNPAGLTASITPASLTVSGVTAQDKVYDATTAASLNTGAASLVGVLAGDAVSVSGLSGTFVDKNAGTNKAVTVAGAALGGADAGNYTVSNPTGLTASITPASLTVGGVTAQDKVYDATTAASLNTGAANLVGVIAGDTVSLSGLSGSFTDKNAGTNKAVTVSGATLGGTDGGNYVVSNPTGLVASITPAALTVSGVTAQDKVYDRSTTATLDTAAANLVGVIAGDTVSVSGLSGSFADRNAGTNKVVTVSGATLGGVDGTNYVVSNPAGLTANITPAALTITGVAAQDKVYDRGASATLDTGAASLVGVIAGDVVSVAGLSGSFADKNAGTNKTVTVTGATLGGTDGGNYTVSNPTGLTASIAQASLTVSGVTAQDKVYDTTATASLNTGAASLVGLLAGDAVSVSGLSGGFADKNAGTNKAVTVSGAALGGADAGNYTVSNPTGLTASITPASLTVSGVTAQDKVYDRTVTASLDTAGMTLAGVLAGDSVNVSGLAGSFADKNAGTNKAVSVNGATLGGADAGNYTVSNPSGLTASITPAALTVSGVTAQDKVYDATTTAALNTGTANLVGVIAGDTVSVSGLAGSFADKNAGTNKSVTVAGATLGGTDSGNYTVANPTGLAASITPASLTVSGITAQDKVYDSTAAATLVGGSLAGVLAGDTVTVSGLAGTFDTKNVGTGKVVSVSGATLGGADAGNYTVANPAALTADVTAATLTVTGVSASSKVYDSTTAATLNGGSLAGVYAGDAVTLTGMAGAFDTKNVGNAKPVTVTGAALAGVDSGNYVVANPTGLTADVTPANLTVAGLSANGKVYDSTTAASFSGGALVGVLAGDAVTLAGASGAFDTKNVGTGKAVTVSGVTLAGSDSGNYVVVAPAGLSASITAATLSLTGVSAISREYDATTNVVLDASGAALAGVLAGDAVSLDTSAARGVFADANPGRDKPVTASGYALSGADAANYALRDPAGLVADVTAAPATAPVPAIASLVVAATQAIPQPTPPAMPPSPADPEEEKRRKSLRLDIVGGGVRLP
ncbi:filamentous hemagglutinin N-terminal domain-containing protein [Ramlibacter sp. G-1-2-2]|uniref:Filamentous hemagglutinin N-terminal domain-containing protein n=1 Tax=Ramlibacter agri TaxID=2728837 RepID=A0A848HE86_9BURK|nr:YDG domain-containing protein [Ramlibacter agri]NML48472.1 filamentous hemagglutinin N-terminal domain-containing protein [Ramlibacter agri]